MNTLKRKRVAILTILAVCAVIVGVSALAASDSRPPVPTTLPVVNLPTPEAEYTKQELDQLRVASRDAWKSHIPVVAGISIQLPDDAKLDALVARVHQHTTVVNGETIEPLELPIYLIIRNNEVASVSKVTGEFQIGENHKETFQFLVDQLGEDKMILIDNDFYEKRWGPHRDDS